MLGAALRHATWKTLVKRDGDQRAIMGMTAVTEAVPSLGLIAVVPWPSPESWPFLVAAVTRHVRYKLLRVKAYQHGDLS